MIFVFGSNELGIHGGGAAKFALDKHGAILYQGFGPQGNAWAIPTCHVPVGRDGWEIPYEQVAFYVECFLAYARSQSDLQFQVTRVGCGLAGWKDVQIAPLFKDAPPNCQFDEQWMPWLGPGKKYWGTV